MMPSLQFLMLNGNQRWSYSDPSTGQGMPAALTPGWTQSTYSIAFPALATLTLWPGNDDICFLTTADGYAEVNPGANLGRAGGLQQSGDRTQPGRQHHRLFLPVTIIT